jgi:two-component sensor histidine kinase
VHETLAEAGDDIAFAEIVRPLTRMAEESLQSPDRPVRFKVLGDGGKLPAAIATPLSVVLTELLQNAADHGFDVDRGRSGGGRPRQRRLRSQLTVRVTDDGVVFPKASASARRPASGCRSCALSSPRNWPAASRCAGPSSTISKRRDR